LPFKAIKKQAGIFFKKKYLSLENQWQQGFFVKSGVVKKPPNCPQKIIMARFWKLRYRQQKRKVFVAV
jgi:hypothetical protein